MSKIATVQMDDANDGNAVLHLSGDWTLQADRAQATALLDALRGSHKPPRITWKDAGITAWDSALPAFVRSIKNLTYGVTDDAMDTTELPEGARRLLALAEQVPERTGVRKQAAPLSLLHQVAERAIRGGRDFVQTLGFVGELTVALGKGITGRARFRRADLWITLQECGPEALPIVSLISLLVGMILAFLGAVQLRMFGAEIFIADAVGIGMVREMGALMTGIIMAGRTGAAFAARLGTMQVNEEVDALETMGFSAMEFLVLPRALALIIMIPLLTLYANILGIAGGAMVSVFMLDLAFTQYYTQTVNAISGHALAAGLIKSVVFGALIAISGCMQGLRCGRSASAVGEATTAAVVNAIVYIVVADALLSVLYVMTGF